MFFLILFPMKKLISILLIIYINLFAVEINQKKIKNANTLLFQIEKKEIKDVKLNFEGKDFLFLKNTLFPHNFYLLLPVPYYQDLKEYPIIISYLENKKKVVEKIKIKIIDGNYKSEIIKVSKSKVTLSKKNKKRTQKEYKEAMKIYRTASPNLYWKSDFIYPLNTKITSDFGNKRVYNNSIKSYHSGTDFRAPNGTPLQAVNDGIIKLAKNRFYSGNSVVIDHGHGVYSCYFHLSKINLKVGTKVKKGQIIGLSGSTGRVTGPHLHFSMRINGILVDPMHLISTLNSIKK